MHKRQRQQRRKDKFTAKNPSQRKQLLKAKERPTEIAKPKPPRRMPTSSILGWVTETAGRKHRAFALRPFIHDFPKDITISKEEIRRARVDSNSIVRVSLDSAGKPGKNRRELQGQILEVFSSIDDPALELAIVQEKHGFPMEFSPEVLHEVEHTSALENPGKRVNLTDDLTVTIDGETARDFDDAISVRKVSAQGFVLRVSIADVSHFVPENSQLDKEARERGTSIYFPGFAIPMLPERLSNNLCSLVPHEERFTLTCEMHLNFAGEVVKSDIYPSVIKSAARLTYTQVSKVLEEKKAGLVSAPIHQMLKEAHELSLVVRDKRKKRGALDLDLPETEIEVDDEGEVTRIYLAERTEAHRLIEDFMILANEVVSESIEKAGYASIFRVHEEPDPAKIEKLQTVVRHWGFSLSEKRGLVDSLQRYLENVRGHQNEKALVISLLRSLKQAEYAATNVGHFGLGSESYCHFTSPIRRYPDLMIHRILRRSNFLKAKQSPYELEFLQQIAKQSSETERRAFLAERDLEDMKKVRFMAPFVGKTFDGIITSVKDFGMFVEIQPYFIDGLIPMGSLPRDFWETNESETSLRGRRSLREFWLGDPVKVSLLEVDRLKSRMSFRYIDEGSEKRQERYRDTRKK